MEIVFHVWPDLLYNVGKISEEEVVMAVQLLQSSVPIGKFSQIALASILIEEKSQKDQVLTANEPSKPVLT